MVYLLSAIGLSPGGSITVHIYTQTIHRTTQITTNLEECGPCPVFKNFTLAFVLELRKLSQGKKTLSQSTVYILPKHPHITKPTHIHPHTRVPTHSHTHSPTPHTRPHIHTHSPTPHTHAHSPTPHTHTHTHADTLKKTTHTHTRLSHVWT